MFRYDRSAIAADHKIRLFTCICAIFWCHKMKLRKVMALAASPSTAIQVAGHRFSLQNAQLIAAVFGRVTTQSTRLFDLVWMLHIMDYDDRDDFNHPLLIVCAATALLFALSGVILLTLSLLPRKQRRGNQSTISSS